MAYVRIPRDEMPSSGFHPLLKDANKQLVYLLRDNKRNLVYMPGITNEGTSIYIDDEDDFKTTPIKYVSKKKLLDYVVAMGYVEMSDEANSNSAKQLERGKSKHGALALKRGRGQYSEPYNHYPEDEEGNKDWSHPVVMHQWKMSRNQDKSGWELDADKYKRMLDSANMETYGRQYDRYTKKLEGLRARIIHLLSNMDLVKKPRNDLSYALRYFEEAIRAFENLQSQIQQILESDMEDEEKNRAIEREFDASISFNSIGDLRRTIERANAALKEYEEGLTESIDESSYTNEMEELADKHNIALLKPMSGDDLRVSGTIRDLDAFYKEAEAKGLLFFGDDEEKYPAEDLDEKLTMKDFPEFREIAKEVGLLTAEDLERFRKEEMQPGESELDAIKRYRDELVASGVDLSILKNESLITEGAMSELDIDIQNGATFSSILKDELVPLKKKLIQLEDAEVRDEEEIDKIKKEIRQVEAKLLVLSKK